MMRKRIFNGLFLILVVVTGLTLAGCPTLDTEKYYWSNYTQIPNKDYEVIGAVVVRDINLVTVSADLMESAIALGGHDIINVRLDWENTWYAWRRIRGASATVIRYKDETLIQRASSLIKIDGKDISTTETYTGENYFMGGEIVLPQTERVQPISSDYIFRRRNSTGRIN